MKNKGILIIVLTVGLILFAGYRGRYNYAPIVASDIDISDVSDDIAADIAYGEYADNTVGADDVNDINCGNNCTWDESNDEIDVDDVFILNTGDSGTGAYDFGGATSFEIPNGNNPTIDAVGEIAFDANDFWFETYDGSANRVIPTVQMLSKTIFDPETISGIEPNVPILPVEADWAPFGIKLISIGIKTDNSSSYSVIFEEWTDPATDSSNIETVATSSSREAEDDGTLSDSDIAVGSIVYIGLPTTSGTNMLQVWLTYYIKDGD